MKAISSTALVVWLFIELCTGQDVSGLPTCGQFCVNQASSLAVANGQCNVGHANCYCTRGDFINQVNTCAAQQCTSDNDKSAVSAFATSFCGASTTLSASTSTAPPSTTKGGQSGGSSAQASSSVTDQSQSSKSSLSTGAIVGIAIGAAAGGILIGIVALLLYRRRKRVSMQQASQPLPTAPVQPMYEVDASTKDPPPKEMEVPQVVHELPAQTDSSLSPGWQSQPSTAVETPNTTPVHRPANIASPSNVSQE